MKRNADEISEWLRTYVGKLVSMPAAEVDTDCEFTAYGLDSASAVGLSVDLGAWLNKEIDATLIYDYTTIDSVSLHLAGANSEVRMAGALAEQ
jgi:acyl carrier protein